MGREDFYSDLSERNREAFCQKQRGVLFFLHVPGLPLSFSVSFSVSSSPFSFFLFLSSYIHRLSLDFIASLPSPHFVPSLFTVLPRFWVCKIISWNFLISLPLFLCFFLCILIASLYFYLGVCLGLTSYLFYFIYNERLLNRLIFYSWWKAFKRCLALPNNGMYCFFKLSYLSLPP